MAKRDGLSPTQKWASTLFFVTGIGFVLLAVFGPILWGADFDAQTLRILGAGLIVVSVYVFVGVNLPALDWSSVAVRVLTGVLDALTKKGGDAK